MKRKLLIQKYYFFKRLQNRVAKIPTGKHHFEITGSYLDGEQWYSLYWERFQFVDLDEDFELQKRAGVVEVALFDDIGQVIKLFETFDLSFVC